MSTFVLPRLLSALRKAANLSQSELAQKLGVTPSAVHQAENIAHPIKEELFARYAMALGYDSELDALDQGVQRLRLEEDIAKRDADEARRRNAPRKRAAKPVRGPTPRAAKRAAASAMRSSAST